MLYASGEVGRAAAYLRQNLVLPAQPEWPVAALEAAGLVETLKGEGPFTVFAPTDAAFEKLPDGAVENLLKPENKDQLIAVLTYHVLPGKVMSADIAGKTLDKEEV